MTPEASPSLERVSYEARLYGHDVYYGFAQYCFWRTVVAQQHAPYLTGVPAYFRGEG